MMEFRAVILAGGRGSRMTDLTATTPKALLPVANRPLIWYPVRMLETAGFEEAIVVTQRCHQADIQTALSELTHLKLDYVSIPGDEDWGTADSLRHIAHKIKSDLLVVSCDLITDVSLHRVADLHRTHHASVTVLLGQQVTLTDSAVPGGKANRKIEKDLVGLDMKGSRVLFFSSESDYEETVSFRRSLFKRHPRISMHTDLLDGHLYLIKRDVLDLLQQDSSLSTIKGELIPQLVRQQFTKQKTTENDTSVDAPAVNENNHQKQDIPNNMDAESLLQMALDMSSTCPEPHVVSKSKSDSTPDKIKCYAYVHRDGLCIRANSLITYCEANRQIPKQLPTFYGDQEISMVHPSATKHQKSTIGADSMVGEQTVIGEKVGIKKCNIGPCCNIGEKVRITNSIIMDHVTINEGCTISGSIICENVELGEKTELKDCLVGSKQTIMPMGKFTNEVIVDLNRMMEV